MNTIPDEPCSPFYPSGVRLGTPLVTTRGMKAKEMKQIGKWIAEVSKYVAGSWQMPRERKLRSGYVRKFKAKANKDKFLLGIYKDVREMTKKFPLVAE
jgi:glycine hydroxymethyltransferase